MVWLGGVADEFGNFVELSKSNRCMGGVYETDRVETIDKTAVYCGYFEYHWGHFLVDTVPRLWYALEANNEVDEYVIISRPFGEKPLLLGNFMEFMELLGIADKVSILHESVRYKCVIVPQLSYDYGDFTNQEERYYSVQYLQTFDYVVKHALNSCKKQDVAYKNVFLTRSGLEFAKKSDFGIEMVDNFFQSNDYQILCPEEVSLRKLIWIMNHCANLASIQGTVSHNHLFIKRDIHIVIIERSSWINTVQNDITMMKNLNVVYVDANLCILPVDISTGPFIYTYNTYLQRYAQERGMNPPIYQYTTKSYRNYLVIKYLEYYQMISYWEWLRKYVGATCFMQKACNESIEELWPDFQFIPYSELWEFTDEGQTKYRAAKYIVDYKVLYKKGEYIDLYQEFVRTIEKAINHGRMEFLIYPFGRNGMLFKRILNERYGIKEKRIFDNMLCKYNTTVSPISDVKKFYNHKSCFVMTSNHTDCRSELIKYFEMNIVEGPFALFHC